MVNNTTNIGLLKPTEDELYSINVSNQNMDLIDTNIKNLQDGQTASEILTKLKTVDGSGSGLDADTVKGYVPINSGIITASNDFIIGSGSSAVVKKTLAETKTILGIDAATETAKGVVELATAAETTTGTDSTKVVHPAGLKVELDKKVNKAGDTLTGPLVVTGRGGTNIKTSKDVLTFANSANTGTLKIALPFSWTNAMMNLTIKGFSFEGGFSDKNAWELVCGGYNALNLWSACSASLLGKANFSKVRFAHDGTNCCILIGDLTTVWDNAHITISEVLSGYTGWNIPTTGWAASVITSEAGITNINQPALHTSSPRMGTIVIPTTGWSAASGVVPYLWYIDISLPGALATDKIDIDVTYPYLQQAVVAQLGPTEERADAVRILAVNIPTVAVQARYTIFR